MDGDTTNKWSQKGDASSSSNSQTLCRRFGKQAMEHHREEWIECQKESKYLSDEYVDEVCLQVKFIPSNTSLDKDLFQFFYVYSVLE